MNKREFVRTLGGASLGLMFSPSVLSRYMAMPHAELAQDEAFWGTIRGKYKLTPEYINLENGYYSMQAEPVLEAFIGHVRSINVQASRYMRTRQPDDKLRVRTRLAKMAGVSPEELIITRNTTESLDTVISGYDWKPGDEAVMAAQDYGAMLDMFKLQARRHGIVNRVVSLPLDPQSDDEVVQLYANAITPKTRLLMVGHMVNITGHILPVRAISDMAHARGVDVMCDGAHAFAPARVPHPRPRLRLLRRVAPQVVRHAARRRHPVRAPGQDRGALADLRGREHGRHRHPEAESHRARTRCTPISVSRTPSTSTRASGSSGRRRASGTCSGTGRRRCVTSRTSCSIRRRDPKRVVRDRERRRRGHEAGRISRRRSSSATRCGRWRSTRRTCMASGSRHSSSPRRRSSTCWSAHSRSLAAVA